MSDYEVAQFGEAVLGYYIATTPEVPADLAQWLHPQVMFPVWKSFLGSLEKEIWHGLPRKTDPTLRRDLYAPKVADAINNAYNMQVTNGINLNVFIQGLKNHLQIFVHNEHRTAIFMETQRERVEMANTGIRVSGALGMLPQKVRKMEIQMQATQTPLHQQNFWHQKIDRKRLFAKGELYDKKMRDFETFGDPKSYYPRWANRKTLAELDLRVNKYQNSDPEKVTSFPTYEPVGRFLMPRPPVTYSA